MRGFRVFAVEVLAGLVAEGILGADGIDGGLGDHGGAVAFEVDPGGNAGYGAGGGKASGVGGGEGVEGEAGAGGVTDEGDVGGIEAVREEMVVGGERVVESGREAILGGEAVIEDKGAGGGGASDARGEIAIVARGAEAVGAAVDIEDGVGGAGFGNGEPVGRGFFDGDAFDVDVRCDGKVLEESVNIGAFFGESGCGLGDEFAPCGDGF